MIAAEAQLKKEIAESVGSEAQVKEATVNTDIARRALLTATTENLDALKAYIGLMKSDRAAGFDFDEAAVLKGGKKEDEKDKFTPLAVNKPQTPKKEEPKKEEPKKEEPKPKKKENSEPNPAPMNKDKLIPLAKRQP